MQKSVQARKNRIISAMSGQFQSGLPIFKMNGNANRNLKVRLMKIIEVKENKKQYLDLLLLADEQEDMARCMYLMIMGSSVSVS